MELLCEVENIYEKYNTEDKEGWKCNENDGILTKTNEKSARGKQYNKNRRNGEGSAYGKQKPDLPLCLILYVQNRVYAIGSQLNVTTIRKKKPKSS